MYQQKKVIITCAVTGSIHTPSMSPYLPVTPKEIADAAIGACEAGAAIIHLHARDPVTGKPDQRPQAFAEFLPAIKRGCDAVALACTEIPLLIGADSSPLPVLDSTRVLAGAAFDVAAGHRPLPSWRGGAA